MEFLKRAAEENLSNLLKETEGIQSHVDNRTPVMEPESPSQTKSPSSDPPSHDSTLDRRIPPDSRQLSSTQNPHVEHRMTPRKRKPPQSADHGGATSSSTLDRQTPNPQ